MKKFLYFTYVPLLFLPGISKANESFSVEIQALTLVMEKYNKELPTNNKTSETNKKPSYMAFKQDECNATVKITEKTGLQIVTMESFDVNVCKKEVSKIIN